MKEPQPMLAKNSVECLELYDYPESGDAPLVPSWSGWDEVEDAGGGPSERGKVSAAREQMGPVEFERRLGEEKRRGFEAGRARGVEEGREAERAANGAASAAARDQQIRHSAELTAEFGRQRDRYFQGVEQEVVKLALAVASRILRREAQTDPLLLMGAVRVALGQLAASTEIRLRVPPADLELWTEAIALLPHTGAKPQVFPGEGMRLGECEIETTSGNADLGIPGQLVEVERSIFEHREEGKRRMPAPLYASTDEASE